jgi:hypothetical protein
MGSSDRQAEPRRAAACAALRPVPCWASRSPSDRRWHGARNSFVGRETPLRISVTPAGDEPCNVEILLPEGSRLERGAPPPPRFEAMVGYTPRCMARRP